MGFKVNVFYNNNKNDDLIKNNLRIFKKKFFLNEEKKELIYLNNLNKIKKLPTIETVNENFQLKKKIFNQILKINEFNIFSNTSSININEIDNRISVLHFFNPIFIGILEVFKSKNINEDGENILNDLKKNNFMILNIPSNDKVVLNKIIFSEISIFFSLIESDRVNKIELLDSYFKIKNINILNLIDIIGADTSIEIFKNLNKSGFKVYLPKFLDQCKQLNILGKKNKQSVSKVFFSENYPNYK